MHEPGSEWLVANPIDVPGFQALLESYDRGSPSYSRAEIPRRDLFRPWVDYGYIPMQSVQPDPFHVLPEEVLYCIYNYLPSKDIARLRTTSRYCRQLPRNLFRKFLLEEYPWLWEVEELPVQGYDWYMMYMLIKECWSNLKGIRNRKRIWRDVDEIVGRIDHYRQEGKIISL